MDATETHSAVPKCRALCPWTALVCSEECRMNLPRYHRWPANLFAGILFVGVLFVGATWFCAGVKADPPDADSPGVDSPQERANRAHLKRLARAVSAYRLIHRGKNPEKISDLYFEDLIRDMEDFRRPGSRTRIGSQTKIDAEGDYTLDPLPGVGGILVREKSPQPGAPGVFVAFQDGSIDVLSLGGARVTKASIKSTGGTSFPPSKVREATAPYDAGRAFERAGNWKAAETAYREAVCRWIPAGLFFTLASARPSIISRNWMRQKHPFVNRFA